MIDDLVFRLIFKLYYTLRLPEELEFRRNNLPRDPPFPKLFRCGVGNQPIVEPRHALSQFCQAMLPCFGHSLPIVFFFSSLLFRFHLQTFVSRCSRSYYTYITSHHTAACSSSCADWADGARRHINRPLSRQRWTRRPLVKADAECQCQCRVFQSFYYPCLVTDRSRRLFLLTSAWTNNLSAGTVCYLPRQVSAQRRDKLRPFRLFDPCALFLAVNGRCAAAVPCLVAV